MEDVSVAKVVGDFTFTLERRGFEVLVFRQPSGTPEGVGEEKIEYEDLPSELHEVHRSLCMDGFEIH